MKSWLVAAVLTVSMLSLPLTAHAGLHAGDVAPDFRGTDLAGVSHTLSQYQGKVVVLYILAHN